MREVTIRSLSNELAENRKMLTAQMDAAKVREAALAESRGEVERLRNALTAEVAYRRARSRNFARSVQDECWRKLIETHAALEAPHEST